MTSFYNGLEVRYKDHEGVINFICEKYITISIEKYDHKSKDVSLLIYQSEWKQVQLMKESEK
jgi:hypothetical protein